MLRSTWRIDGLRSTKTVAGSTITYTWDLNNGLPAILQDGSQTYVYGRGGLISQTDGSGNVVATYKYDIFGAVRASTGSGSAEYRFTGQQDDATLGYTYLRARYYDPYTGRFLSKDPFPGVLTNPASQHYYGYAQNNPVNGMDPSGRAGPGILLGLGAAAAGVDLSGALIWVGVGVAAAEAGVAALVHWDDISDFVGSCLEQQGQYLEESSSIYYTKGNPAQDRLLTPGKLKKLDRFGGPEKVKQDIVGKRNSGKYDLYEDDQGGVIVKPKGGKGEGEPTGINLNDLD